MTDVAVHQRSPLPVKVAAEREGWTDETERSKFRRLLLSGDVLRLPYEKDSPTYAAAQASIADLRKCGFRLVGGGLPEGMKVENLDHVPSPSIRANPSNGKALAATNGKKRGRPPKVPAVIPSAEEQEASRRREHRGRVLRDAHRYLPPLPKLGDRVTVTALALTGEGTARLALSDGDRQWFLDVVQVGSFE